MLPSTTLPPTIACLGVWLELQRIPAATAASSVDEPVSRYTHFPLTAMERVASQPLLNASTPGRPLFGVALMLTLLVTTFLLLRCAYRISAIRNESEGTKERRASESGWSQPCELPQHHDQQQRQQPKQQKVAAAASAKSKAAAGPSSGERAAASRLPAAVPPGYSPATYLDSGGVAIQSALLNTWLVQAQAAETLCGAGSSIAADELDEMLLEGIQMLGHVQAITFSTEVGTAERQGLMRTIGECTALLRRLVGGVKQRWIDACKTQTNSLKSTMDGALADLKAVLGRNLFDPNASAVTTMIRVREAVNEAKKVHTKTKCMTADFLDMGELETALASLVTVIKVCEESLAMAAEACAEAWATHLKVLHRKSLAEGTEGRESTHELRDKIRVARDLQAKLRLISGKAASD